MALTSTLFTGLSGLVVNQTALNVVGNNIANANTTAFKASRAIFSPQFYVTDNAGSPTTGEEGGSNPTQEGLGAQVSTIQQDFTAGSLQSTGVQSDLAINGNGFFIVNSASEGQLFTRAGDFTLNDQHQLVDSSGDFVQGYGVDSNFQLMPGGLQNLTIPIGTETIAKATQNASLNGNLDAGGAVAAGGSQLLSNELISSAGVPVDSTTPLTDLQDPTTLTNLYNVGNVITLAGQQDGRALPSSTLTVTANSTVADLQTFLASGLVIDSNPPTSAQGTLANPVPPPGVTIVTAADGNQQIQIIGNAGTENSLSLSGTALTDSSGTNPLSFITSPGTPAASGESTHSTIIAYDSLGNQVTLNVNTVFAGKNNSGGTTWNFYVSSPDNQGPSPVLGTGTLNFGPGGNLSSVTGNTLTLDRAGTGASPSQQITLDFGSVEALAGSPSNVVSQSGDGFEFGTLDNYSIGTDGTITGSFSNGLTRTIGQVALANFNNNDGLIDKGNSLYASGSDSGTPIITTAGTQGVGTILQGTLESSNVDLSKEFINLIIASTGYSASSRVISTSSQLLTDLLNSQR